MDNKSDSRPHTQRVPEDSRRPVHEVNVMGYRMSGKMEVRDETATLRVELPGVPKDRIEVKMIENTLRIRVQPAPNEREFDIYNQQDNVRQLVVLLSEFEEPREVKLELGILTVEINRGRIAHELTING